MQSIKITSGLHENKGVEQNQSIKMKIYQTNTFFDDDLMN